MEMFVESSFKYTPLPFQEKKDNQAVWRLDDDLGLRLFFLEGDRGRLSENICFPLATQIATSIAK